jgi:hypothetical protein
MYTIHCGGPAYKGSSTDTRDKENHQYICLYYLNKTTIERSINLGHSILIQATGILAKVSESSSDKDTEFHPNNMNREDGFSVVRSRKPLIHNIKERKKVL